MKTNITAFEPDLLELAVAFTERYKASVALNKSACELACLKEVFPATLMGPESGDLFAGRIVLPLAGFSSGFYPEQDMSDSVGYYYDHYRTQRILTEHNLEKSEIARKLAACAAFWKENDTYMRVKRAMDDNMRMAVPSRRFPADSAISHRLYRIASISADYTPLLELGIKGLQEELRAGLEKTDSEGRDFLSAGIDYFDLILDCVEAYRAEFSRLAANEQNLARRAEFNRTAQALESLSHRPPQTLFDAIQLVHLYTIVSFECNAFGRLDDIYGPFLVRDLENGTLSRDEAVRLLTSYWQLLDEHFINSRMTLGGKGRKNPKEADVFCSVAFEATQLYYTKLRKVRNPARQTELSPQVAFRMSDETPAELRSQALDVIAAGTTFPLLYRDESNIPAVANAFRISEEDAAQYTFFDCGEYIIHGKSVGTPTTIINLPKALEVALHNGIDPRNGRRLGPPNPSGTDFSSFEKVWEAYDHQVRFTTGQCARFQKLEFDVLNQHTSFLGMSLMLEASRKAARGLLDGGCEMLGGTYETYGNITAADSLFAIRKAVYEQKRTTIEELIKQQDSNFIYDPKLKKFLQDLPKFGNDIDEVDAMAQQVNEHICTLTRNQADKVGLHHFLVVVINNGANVLVGRHVNATADGRESGKPVSNGHTPTAGRDKEGITALLNSILKLSPMLHAGAVHNLRFSRKTMTEKRAMVEAMLKSYFERGGTQCMVTVTSRDELEDAIKHPENYGHLMVRVGGYSARFITLPPDIQMEIVNRNAY